MCFFLNVERGERSERGKRSKRDKGAGDLIGGDGNHLLSANTNRLWWIWREKSTIAAAVTRVDTILLVVALPW